MKHFLAISCSFLVACAASKAPPSAKRLTGEWYRGDGLGCNISLTLNRDSTYTGVWTGCLGTYGNARGKWSLAAGILSFTPSQEDGMMKNHLRTLNVVPVPEGVVLVPPENRKEFNEYGTRGSYWCFKKKNSP